jgi:hypothetical protein
VQLSVELYEDTDAHRADIAYAGKVQSDVVSTTANHLLEGAGQMISPVTVEAAFNDEFGELTCALLSDLHTNSQLSLGFAS